jgi:nucleoid DNA-binding protein
LTKKDLVAQVADKLGLTQTLVKAVFENSLVAITDALTNGEKVELRDFGVFKVKERKGRIGRNPKTGDAVSIPPRRVAYFKPGKEMKERVMKR